MKRLIALLFCLLIFTMPMAGCLGGDDSSDVPVNHLPIILGETSYGDWGDQENVLLVSALSVDSDGLIIECGIDFDADGLIEFQANCDDWNKTQVVSSTEDYFWLNNGLTKGANDWCYMWLSLIAIDDNLGKTVKPFRIFTEYDEQSGCTNDASEYMID